MCVCLCVYSYRARWQLRGGLPPGQRCRGGAERTLHLGTCSRQTLIGDCWATDAFFRSRPLTPPSPAPPSRPSWGESHEGEPVSVLTLLTPVFFPTWDEDEQAKFLDGSEVGVSVHLWDSWLSDCSFFFFLRLLIDNSVLSVNNESDCRVQLVLKYLYSPNYLFIYLFTDWLVGRVMWHEDSECVCVCVCGCCVHNRLVWL